jgi:hypothetical protein
MNKCHSHSFNIYFYLKLNHFFINFLINTKLHLKLNLIIELNIINNKLKAIIPIVKSARHVSHIVSMITEWLTLCAVQHFWYFQTSVQPKSYSIVNDEQCSSIWCSVASTSTEYFNFAEPKHVLEHLTLEHLALTLKLIKIT